MRHETVLYSVIIVCVTAIVIVVMHFNNKSRELELDLVVECIYANGSLRDPVSRCATDIVPRMMRLRAAGWEADNENGVRGSDSGDSDSDGDL